MSIRLDPLALPLRGSRLIEASAGTGKTWTIAGLYLRLVLGHGTDETRFGAPLGPPEILVMTFTRAATRELSDRIRARLVEAAEGFRGTRAVGLDDALLRGLVDAYPPGPAREAAAWRLAMAAEGMDDAAVFTIDAWVQRMLREHAFDSGCLFDEEVQPDELAMLDEAVRDYWRQEVYPLDDRTLDAVLSVWPNVAALAGDVQRLRHDLPEDRADDESLAMLWRRENAERARLLASLKEDWTIRAAKMRRWLLEQIAVPNGPFNRRKMQAGYVNDWTDRLARWADDPLQAALGLTPTAILRLSPRGLTDALAPGRTVEIPAQFEAFPQLVAAVAALPEPVHAVRLHAALRIERRLRTLKRRAGIYGFDDMLKRLDAALRGPAGGRLRARIVAQYPVAMIDEFQDTSTVQYRIFDRLYDAAANDRATALLLIGDPKQSIFAFRRADIRSYLRARASMGDRHYVLGTNYRSTAALVATVNRLFDHAEAGDEDGGGAFRFGATLPFVPVDARGRRERLVASNGPVPALTLAHDAVLATRSEARQRLAAACAEHIVAALNDPRAGFDDPHHGFTKLEMSDITVLVRDRTEAAAVRQALRRRGVASVYLSDQDSVFLAREAADLLHWLRAVAEPTDGRRARVAFATTLVGLPLDRLARLGHDDVAFEARLDDLKMLHGVWRRQGVLPMLRRTLHLLDLPARWLRDADGERRLTNVLHLAELLQAAGASLDGEHALIRWLAEQVDRKRVAADEQIVRLESDADLVKVMTVWMAKGLEYPVVYIPFVCSYREAKTDDVTLDAHDDGTRSLRFTVTEADRQRSLLESQQEDVRLLYVAMTRARHALWLGIAPLKGKANGCAFCRSAFGYLVGGPREVAAGEIAGLLARVFADLPSVATIAVDADLPTTPLRGRERPQALVDAPDYAGVFERDWSIGSFSAFVRDLARVPMSATVVEPAVEEELLAAAGEDDAAIPSSAPRHRFPRGALPGNFLHDQLQWLAEHRFALADDADLRAELARRCERDGWGHRAHDVVAWLGEVAAARLPPIGVALRELVTIVPEMEFWFPNDGLGARDIDRLCRRHLLGGRERPALPDRTLRGMLMGFADLVFESGGRYWVLDYKSNALGASDADYTPDALERSMADHRYDVQAAIYLLALHRLLKQRLGADYDPARQLGGALYLFLRGIAGPVSGCYVVEPTAAWLDALDDALHAGAFERS